jgi:hypothetical protein
MLPDGYTTAADLGDFLGKSEMDIARLGKAGILVRKPDPQNRRAFLYELRGSVRGYVAHLAAPTVRAQGQFVREKARTQKVARQRLELEIGIKNGRLVPREGLLRELTSRFLVFKRRLRAVPTRVSGAFARNEEERRKLEAFLEIEVEDSLAVLARIFGDDVGERNGETRSEDLESVE